MQLRVRETNCRVASKLVEVILALGLKRANGPGGEAETMARHIPRVSKVFTRKTHSALETVAQVLEKNGMSPEERDTAPLHVWTRCAIGNACALVYAGRYGPWKDSWSHHCVPRGEEDAEEIG